MKQEVNFVEQISCFERWLETNYLSTGAQLLWYKLFALFNRSRWQEWITVENRRLMSMLQVNRENTFVEWRRSLENAGLLEFVKGTKGRPSRYKMVYFKGWRTPEAVAAEVASLGKNSEFSTSFPHGHSPQSSSMGEVLPESDGDTDGDTAADTDGHTAADTAIHTDGDTDDIIKQNKIKQDETSHNKNDFFCNQYRRSVEVSYVGRLVAYLDGNGVKRQNENVAWALEEFLGRGMSADLVRYAVDRAASKGEHWNYVRGILEEKFKKGILTMGQLSAQEKASDDLGEVE